MATLHDNTKSIQDLLDSINDLPLDKYDEGYEKGYTEGEQKGYADGLAARSYETWEITLTDGTVIEKEVALL